MFQSLDRHQILSLIADRTAWRGPDSPKDAVDKSTVSRFWIRLPPRHGAERPDHRNSRFGVQNPALGESLKTPSNVISFRAPDDRDLSKQWGVCVHLCALTTTASTSSTRFAQTGMLASPPQWAWWNPSIVRPSQGSLAYRGT
jgi:hypothetical protein